MQHGHIARLMAASLVSLLLAACGGGDDDHHPGAGADAEAQGQASALAGSNARGGGGGGGGSGAGGGGASSAVVLSAEPGARSITLGWADSGTAQYNVVVASSPGCDINRYTQCPDGRLLVNVRPPQRIEGLQNGRVYYARVQALSNTGTTLSNEAGARPDNVAFNAAVRAIGAGAGGVTYLGGEFTKAGIVSGQGVALDMGTGRARSPGFAIVSGGEVSAAAPDGAGGWYIGGSFQRVGAVEKRYLAHLRADGSLDTAWNPVPNSAVQAIAVMGGVVYLGGDFTTLNGQQRIGLAAVNGSGQLMAWNPNPNLGVSALAAANGTIYAGGTFTVVGAFARSHLVAIDTNANVLPWNPGADNTVQALAVAGGTVYAGGFFSTVGGQVRSCLAAIEGSGAGRATAWDVPVGSCPANPVRAIAVHGGTVYVGGHFTQIGRQNTPRNRLAAIDPAGNVLPWNPNADDAVHALAIGDDPQRGTTVFAGGDFTDVGGQTLHHLAAIDLQGAVRAWKPAPTGRVQALAAAGSAVYAGGEFTALGAVMRKYLAALDGSGNLAPWNPGADSSVLALAVTGHRIHAGGTFGRIGGQARQRLAVIDSAGVVGSWNPGVDRTVRAIATLGGNVYVGGEFTTAAGQLRNHLAAFGAAGELLAWDPNADRDVHALAVTPDLGRGETEYVGGAFGYVGGQTRRRLAQVDAQGLPTPWNPAGFENIANGAVVNVLRVADEVIYAGGSFSQIGIYGRHGIAAIGSGGNVLPWSPAANGVVWALDVANGTVYVGGEFTQIANAGPAVQTRNGLAAIRLDGLLSTWDPNVHGAVYSLSAGAGSIHAGGAFDQVGSAVAGGFAMLAP